MDSSYFIASATALFFGGLLAFGFWELYSVSLAKKQRLERERARSTKS
jgi:hypothetical protein